jgi:soluble lytic murein transglycosylase-like protein
MKRIERLLITNLETPRRRPSPAVVALLCCVTLGAGVAACAPTIATRPASQESAEGDSALKPAEPTTESGSSPQTDIADASSSLQWLPAEVRRFESELRAAATRHDVPMDLLAIITALESRGNPVAQSPMGARGLMQLMPATAESIAAERGISGFSAEQLDDPAYNIDMGAYYLAQQLQTFGDVELAAAAYNAGPNKVRAHVEKGEALSEETRRYRERVAALWAERQSASGEAAPETP